MAARQGMVQVRRPFTRSGDEAPGGHSVLSPRAAPIRAYVEPPGEHPLAHAIRSGKGRRDRYVML